MVTVHSAVTLAVAASTTSRHCTCAACERSVRRLAVHLTAARVRAMRPQLDGYTRRNGENVTIQLRYAAVDGRVGEVYRKTIFGKILRCGNGYANGRAGVVSSPPNPGGPTRRDGHG